MCGIFFDYVSSTADKTRVTFITQGNIRFHRVYEINNSDTVSLSNGNQASHWTVSSGWKQDIGRHLVTLYCDSHYHSECSCLVVLFTQVYMLTNFKLNPNLNYFILFLIGQNTKYIISYNITVHIWTAYWNDWTEQFSGMTEICSLAEWLNCAV